MYNIIHCGGWKEWRNFGRAGGGGHELGRGDEHQRRATTTQ